jgi:hypothetical protein
VIAGYPIHDRRGRTPEVRPLHYRVYKLDPAGRIMSGAWIEAEDEPQARAEAQALCDQASPHVELWQGTRKVAVLPCTDKAV